MRTIPFTWDARIPAALCPALQDRATQPRRATAHRRRILGGYLLSAAVAVTLSLGAGMTAATGQPESDPSPPEAPDEAAAKPKQVEKPVVIVEGQVTNHIGAGQEGVTITVRRKLQDGSIGDIIVTTTTNALGDFAVTTSEPIHGDIIVTFSKPLYAELTREVRIGDGEFPPFLAETLEGKLQTVGRVVDALTKKPIVDGSVKLTAQYKDWYETTDDDGRFTIKGVFPGRGVLVVEAKGYGRDRWPIPDLEDEGDIIIRLKPERIVHIKTIDEKGEPIAGVAVECHDQSRDDFRTVVTDKSGSVTLRGLHFAADILSVRLTHEEYVSSLDFDREILTPDDKPESTHKLVMVRAGRITGLVTDAKTGEPVHGARIMTGEEYTDASPRDWTDHQGRYTVRGVKPGHTTVTLHASDHAPDLKTVEVSVGGTAKLDFPLQAGTVLSGVVKDKEDKPVVWAYVDATRWRGQTTLGLRAVTNEKGRFVIADTPHDEFEIDVMAHGYEKVSKTVVADPSKEVEIVLLAEDVGQSPDAPAPKIGDQAPELTLTTLRGRVLTPDDLKGKTVLLDFWATWCPPCIVEIPQLIAVYERFCLRKDFVMVGISRDFDKKSLTRFLKKSGKMKWHHVFGEAAGGEAACKKFGVRGVPRNFLIGPDGKILAIDLRPDQIVKSVEQALKGDGTK